jgi:hypothetical protein
VDPVALASEHVGLQTYEFHDEFGFDLQTLEAQAGARADGAAGN